MRVSTSQIYNIANIGMAKAQAAVARTDEQIASGKRLLSPADDPVAATTILQITQELSRIEQYNKNITIAENNLNLEEVALESVTNLIHRMKEIAVAAGNTAVLTEEDYKAYAAEIDSRIEELLNLQNTRSSTGQYIFAGYQGGTQPFTSDGGGNYSYHGDEGQLRLQASTTVSVAVSDSGKRIFMDIPSGHNTITTSANPANRAVPAATISVGQVVDQEAFDGLFPEDMVITFNAPSAVAPAANNYTITERNTGRVLVANAVYSPGEEITVNGVSLHISGSPMPPTAASLPFAFNPAAAPIDFATNPTTLTVSVEGRTETLELTTPVNNAAEFAAALSAGSNGAKLANLGLTVTADGIVSANGKNITLRGGNADIDNATGLATSTGVTSSNGRPGDAFFVESTNKQPLITTLARFSDAMKHIKPTEEGRAQFRDMVDKTLVNLNFALTNITSIHGEVGARLNTLESSKDLNLDTVVHNNKVLKDLRDLDYAEASTRLQMETFILSAAQQSFVKVSQLTLFSYL
ncbi:MAG: flagellar hook-associated protein FlgL [Cellvibrio sp.]|jgi:flagellar hook-associated protein 3 FlgL